MAEEMGIPLYDNDEINRRMEEQLEQHKAEILEFLKTHKFGEQMDIKIVIANAADGEPDTLTMGVGPA